ICSYVFALQRRQSAPRAISPRPGRTLSPLFRVSIRPYAFQINHSFYEFLVSPLQKPIVCVSRNCNKYHQEKRLLT
ncbi:hypothetical protein, partial [Klebsiella michiganensis]|uniref:hypothetical protein n=1 Tax=Klebsiella michiganensis TaxID=1134687 RepID=UPI001CE27A3E